MADYPGPSDTSMGKPADLTGFEAKQPPKTVGGSGRQVIDGSRWLNPHAPGKMNENRSTTLRPAGKQKTSGNTK